MSTSTRPAFRPAGYCPRCGYAIDPGVCPECGRDVPARRLRRRPPLTPRRRWLRRGVAAVLILLPVAAWQVATRVQWQRYVPDGLLFRLDALGVPGAWPELNRRLAGGKLGRAEVRRLVDPLFVVETEIPIMERAGARGLPDDLHIALHARLVATSSRVCGAPLRLQIAGLSEQGPDGVAVPQARVAAGDVVISQEVYLQPLGRGSHELDVHAEIQVLDPNGSITPIRHTLRETILVGDYSLEVLTRDGERTWAQAARQDSHVKVLARAARLYVRVRTPVQAAVTGRLRAELLLGDRAFRCSGVWGEQLGDLRMNLALPAAEIPETVGFRIVVDDPWLSRAYYDGIERVLGETVEWRDLPVRLDPNLVAAPDARAP